MPATNEFNRQVRQAALLTVGLLAALCFGIIVLVGGDWLCRQTPPEPPHSRPTH